MNSSLDELIDILYQDSPKKELLNTEAILHLLKESSNGLEYLNLLQILQSRFVDNPKSFQNCLEKMQEMDPDNEWIYRTIQGDPAHWIDWIEWVLRKKKSTNPQMAFPIALKTVDPGEHFRKGLILQLKLLDKNKSLQDHFLPVDDEFEKAISNAYAIGASNFQPINPFAPKEWKLCFSDRYKNLYDNKFIQLTDRSASLSIAMAVQWAGLGIQPTRPILFSACLDGEGGMDLVAGAEEKAEAARENGLPLFICTEEDISSLPNTVRLSPGQNWAETLHEVKAALQRQGVTFKINRSMWSDWLYSIREDGDIAQIEQGIKFFQQYMLIQDDLGWMWVDEQNFIHQCKEILAKLIGSRGRKRIHAGHTQNGVQDIHTEIQMLEDLRLGEMDRWALQKEKFAIIPALQDCLVNPNHLEDLTEDLFTMQEGSVDFEQRRLGTLSKLYQLQGLWKTGPDAESDFANAVSVLQKKLEKEKWTQLSIGGNGTVNADDLARTQNDLANGLFLQGQWEKALDALPLKNRDSFTPIYRCKIESWQAWCTQDEQRAERCLQKIDSEIKPWLFARGDWNPKWWYLQASWLRSKLRCLAVLPGAEISIERVLEEGCKRFESYRENEPDTLLRLFGIYATETWLNPMHRHSDKAKKILAQITSYYEYLREKGTELICEESNPTRETQKNQLLQIERVMCS